MSSLHLPFCLLPFSFCLTSALALDFAVIDKTHWRGDKAADVAANVSETYRYDAASDTLTVSTKFDRRGFAPLPPMLALAVQYGFRAEFEPAMQRIEQASAIGPLMGVPNADGYTCRIKGLSRYVQARPRPGGGAVPERLQQELAAEVTKLLQAGHLRPWLSLVNPPGSGADARGDVYWDNPGEVLYLLAEAAPLLPEDLARQVATYMKAERAAAPPELRATLSYVDGTPREAVPMDKRLLAQWQDKFLAHRTKAPAGVWNLYGLARYYELTGEKPSPEVMRAASEIVSRQLEHRDWATLYWQRGHTPHFNATHGVNQLFAGFIGYIRLARMAGDDEAVTLGYAMLARTAALRFAMGKYTQFLHDSHQFSPDYGVLKTNGEVRPEQFPITLLTDPKQYSIPADPAWWAKRRAGSWIGDLTTWNWTKPIDNLRQIDRLDETGVDLWEWCGVDCGGTGQKRDSDDKKDYWYKRLAPYLLFFRDMTPELGLFIADHLKPEAAAFCARIVENQPHWYMAYCEAMLSAECGFNSPADAYGHFLTRAWVLGDPPAQLERCIDVPHVATGDLYHLHKLVETVRTYRAAAP